MKNTSQDVRPLHVKEIFRADIQNLPDMVLFLEGTLSSMELSPTEIFDLQLAADEIFTNIASYAYGAEGGSVSIEVIRDATTVIITFTDSGMPFNPENLPPPDISLDLSDRKIGGLGIYLARQLTDRLTYRRDDGKNILTIKKAISQPE